jgi:hypothetical protein
MGGVSLGAVAAFLLAAGLAAEEPPAPRLRCPLDYLDVAALEAMLAAQEVNALEAAYAGVLVPDSVTRLIYASRMATVAPGKRADLLIIEAMPRTRSEFDLLASLADPDVKIHARVANIAAGNWLDQALAAVVRQETGAREFLMLALLAQDHLEMAALLPAMQDTLRQWKPALFAAAYASLPEKVRRLIDAGSAGRGHGAVEYNIDIVIAPRESARPAPARLGSANARACAAESARTVRDALGGAPRIRIEEYDPRRWKSPEIAAYIRRILDAQPEGGALQPGVYWAEAARAEIAGWIEGAAKERRRVEFGNGYVCMQDAAGCALWGRYLGPDRSLWIVREPEPH